ncbi:MAG: hypothetical protein KGH60_02825 [Candidatus Micrarchaeota archaeon]|nr:hypothetical protein [Candidatus Micrarchaeota archaeon]
MKASPYESRKVKVSEPDDEAKQEKPAAKKDTTINVTGPLVFWIGFLVLGLAIELLFVPLANAGNATGAATFLTQIGGYILYIPGAIILPLIVALWLGERVGASGKPMHPAIYSSLINALYTALIYVVSIFIIYLVIKYAGITLVSGLTLVQFVEYVIAVPVVILLVLVPLFTTLSVARRSR